MWCLRGCGCGRGRKWPRQVFASRLVFSNSPAFVTVFFSHCRFSDVRVKDLVRNITAFTEELRSARLSAETISSILEASISRSQVQCGRFRPRAPGLLACPPPAPPTLGWAAVIQVTRRQRELQVPCLMPRPRAPSRTVLPPWVRKDEIGDGTHSRDSQPRRTAPHVSNCLQELRPPLGTESLCRLTAERGVLW